jgi:acid phosphatase class B
MKAIAKQDIGYAWYDYINFVTGKSYEVKENNEEFLIDIFDEKNEPVTYCGNKEFLKEQFDFVEE